MSEYCSSLAKSVCGNPTGWLVLEVWNRSRIRYTLHAFLHSQSLAIEWATVHSSVAVTCGDVRAYSSFADGFNLLFENEFSKDALAVLSACDNMGCEVGGRIVPCKSLNLDCFL